MWRVGGKLSAELVVKGFGGESPVVEDKKKTRETVVDFVDTIKRIKWTVPPTLSSSSRRPSVPALLLPRSGHTEEKRCLGRTLS